MAAMSDTPTKTYPPEFLQRLVDDHEAERQADTGLPTQHRGDNLLHVEAPELPGAAFAYNEAERAGATPEESSAVETKGDAMSEAAHETTETQGTVTVSDHVVKHWHRRERYRRAIVALRDTLAHLQGGQTVSTKQMRDRVVELLDALLDMETGGTR